MVDILTCGTWGVLSSITCMFIYGHTWWAEKFGYLETLSSAITTIRCFAPRSSVWIRRRCRAFSTWDFLVFVPEKWSNMKWQIARWNRHSFCLAVSKINIWFLMLDCSHKYWIFSSPLEPLVWHFDFPWRLRRRDHLRRGQICKFCWLLENLWNVQSCFLNVSKLCWPSAKLFHSCTIPFPYYI